MGFFSDPIGSVLRGLLSIGYDGPGERVNRASGPDGEQIRFRDKATDISTEGSYIGKGWRKKTITIGDGWSTHHDDPINRG